MLSTGIESLFVSNLISQKIIYGRKKKKSLRVNEEMQFKARVPL